MNAQNVTAAPTCRRAGRVYECRCLPELVQSIVDRNDRAALKELHDHRTVFGLGNGKPMLFVQFVDALRVTPWALGLVGGIHAALETARDLTIDKFSRLPHDDGPQGAGRRNGVDCRRYLGGYLSTVSGCSSAYPDATDIEREMAAAKLLERFVLRHFRLSCLEAKRRLNPARSRYVWQVAGRSIYLWMPRHMRGRQCREWLEENVDHPDPAQPGEQRRVQRIVDARLGIPLHVPLDLELDAASIRHPRHVSAPSALEAEVSVRGLAAAVADEKAETVDSQRPSVRALGSDALRGLILRIFDELSAERHDEKGLAQAFGLSPSTFSRFAGSRWRPEPGRRPPDLWHNVAQTLSRHRPFIEAAAEAGVWQQAQEALGQDGTLCDGSHSHV